MVKLWGAFELCMKGTTLSYKILNRHREIWHKKKILKEIYHNWYDMIIENLADKKPVFEIGSGGGNFRELLPDIISSDIILCEWNDLNSDAHALPFKNNSIGNIISIDVLHHLEKPVLFFEEAQRTLQERGRIIMLEPYISPFSFLVYKFFHQEKVCFTPVNFNEGKVDSVYEKKPFDGNSAIPTSMFTKQIGEFRDKFPDLRILKKYLVSFVIYPLSGGFEHKSLIRDSWLRYLWIIEDKLRIFAKLLALRVFLVIEKRN